MKSLGRGCFACLLILVSWVGTVCPSTDPPARTSDAAGREVHDLSGNLERVGSGPSGRCCDIAFMDAFRVNKLQYARTAEFVQAVRMVASGESRYSPGAGQDIPLAAWKEFAKEMRRHFVPDTSEAAELAQSVESSHVHAEHDNLRLVHDRKCLIGALVYLASLEYRSWPGHEGISPIFPRIFGAAVDEFDARLAEKRRMAEAYAKRAAAIVARIEEAERTGARRFSPDELARAKSELERARQHASGVRSSLLETDTAFARAERVASGLLRR